MSEESEIKDTEFSENEGTTVEKPVFSGLFQPAHFKTLLSKAKALANFGAQAAAPGPMASTALTDSFFTEQAIKAETVPAPKVLLDVVQRQWASPTSGPIPSSADK